jgi:predicted glycoside hydrolase/deacetylase ChbG (UPF0249 family)
VKSLIVNADDFGRTPGVNAGVLEAHCRGIVTSATVMVLEKAAPRGIREASERARRLSLGLHFCVTGGGPPGAAARYLPTLAPDGRFPRTPEELPERIPAAEVRAELEAQIEIFRMLARKDPTHLDSHHRSRGLPARAPNEAARRALRAARVATPDRFEDGFHGDGVSIEGLARILEELPDGVTELMCHPAVVDDELRGGSRYADRRDDEREILGDPQIRQIVRARQIRLVGFEVLLPRMR